MSLLAVSGLCRAADRCFVHVRVVRTLRSYVSVAEEFSPDPSAPSAIAWSLNVTGLASTPFTLPVSTSFAFDKQTAAEVQWWAPWDRG